MRATSIPARRRFAWRPLGEDRVVRERYGFAIELRTGNAGGNDLSRRDEFAERVCVDLVTKRPRTNCAWMGSSVKTSFRCRTIQVRRTTNARRIITVVG